jgi:hypothetical protein
MAVMSRNRRRGHRLEDADDVLGGSLLRVWMVCPHHPADRVLMRWFICTAEGPQFGKFGIEAEDGRDDQQATDDGTHLAWRDDPSLGAEDRVVPGWSIPCDVDRCRVRVNLHSKRVQAMMRAGAEPGRHAVWRLGADLVELLQRHPDLAAHLFAEDADVESLGMVCHRVS